MIAVPVGRISIVKSWEEKTTQVIRKCLAEFYNRDFTVDDIPAMQTWVSNEDNHLLLAMHNGEWVGMAWVHVINEPLRTTGIVNHVIVLSEHRGQGIGKALMLELHSKARQLGCSRLKLTSRPSREAAHHLYKSLGYEERETCVFQLEL